MRSNTEGTAVEASGGRVAELLDELIAGIARSDQAALSRMYDLTSSAVYSLALRVLANKEDAEEVVLDVYTKVWRTAVTYDRNRGTVLGWLLMMARSQSIDRLRQRKARSAVEPAEEILVQTPSSEPSPEQETFLNWERRRVQRLLAQLSPEQAEALRMAYYSGLSHAELADRLGLPLGTVKTRIRLGLNHMRQLLESAHAEKEATAT